jgi:hypothetical protein
MNQPFSDILHFGGYSLAYSEFPYFLNLISGHASNRDVPVNGIVTTDDGSAI